MPVYDGEEFLAEAVESILGQSFTDFEFVIVDDGSTDGSPALLERYAAADRRVRVITNEANLGIVGALNRGLDACRGEYVARMDADDIATADRLEKQVAALDADEGIIVLGGSLRYIDAAGGDLDVVRRCETGKSILTQTPMLHPTAVIRRAGLREHGIRYRERYRYAEDYYLWLELSRLGRITAIDDVVLWYRVSRSATRVKHLKGVLKATLRAKKDAVFKLGIRPKPADLLRFLMECVLYVLPAPFVLWIYLKVTFGRRLELTA